MLTIFSSLFSVALVSAPVDVQVLENLKPVSKQEVELVGFADGKSKYEFKKTTDFRGRVRFDIDTKQEVNIIIRVISRKLQYVSSIFSSADLPKVPIQILVYRVTESDPLLAIDETRVFLKKLDENLQIEETFVIKNDSQFTVVGKQKDPGNSSEAAEVFRFSIPTGAYDFRVISHAEEGELRFDNQDVVVARAIPPGTLTYRFTYSVKTKNHKFHFQQKLSLPTRSLSYASGISEAKISGIPEFQSRAPNKFLDNELISTYETEFPSPQKLLSFDLENLPGFFNLVLFLPLVSLVLLAIASALFIKRPHQFQMSSASKERLLNELKILEQMKNQKLISIRYYQNQRLNILQELALFYTGPSGVNS